MPQNSRPRVAAEGYASSQLPDGIVIDIRGADR